jgi:hypothetical protein
MALLKNTKRVMRKFRRLNEQGIEGAIMACGDEELTYKAIGKRLDAERVVEFELERLGRKAGVE